jgi:choline dehydrogenase-like flavoprotein
VAAFVALGHPKRLGSVGERLMVLASLAQLRSSGFRPSVCIVGAGPAGITLALRLQARKVPCLLIEAGNWYPSELSQNFYRGKVVGDRYHELNRSRLRQFGGTSGHWSGWCRALDAVDFEVREHVPHSGWPIRKRDLDPYAVAAAEMLQIKPRAVDRAVSADMDEIEFRFSRPPTRFGTAYRRAIERSRTIGLLLNTAVTELVPGQGRIDSLVLADAGRQKRELRIERVCLCAGGIENSRLLLWSNARHANGVVREPGTLGRYWMEHPVFVVGEAAIFDHVVPKFTHKRFFAPSVTAMKSYGIGGAHLGVDAPTPESKDFKRLRRELMCVAPRLFEDLLARTGRELVCGTRVVMEWEQLPRPENRIELDRDTDPFGVPRVRLHWTKSAAERKCAVVASRLLGEALIKQDIGRLRISSWLLDEEPWPEHDQLAGAHHMGGTRMSDKPATGVVDSNCRVFGMANLYIGGSSVFPTGGHANPTFTIVQLALRLGDHLAATSAGAA